MPRPDEGVIHAWLDGQLPPDEAARIEELAATDPEWAAAVAEARGLVAASSRILSALDHVPAGVLPKGTATRVGQRLPWWTKAAAAVVLVAGGSVLVMQRMPDAVAPVPGVAGSRKPDVVKVPTVVDQPTVASAAPKQDTPPSTVTKPQSAPVPAASNAVQMPAPISVAREAPRVVSAEPKGKTSERMAIAPVTPPVPAMLAEETKDAALEARPAARSVAGVVGASGATGAARMAPVAKSLACYRLERDRAPSGFLGVMRTERTDGDTLRLVPAQDSSPLRAWIVQRDGAWRGAAVPVPAGRDTIPVVATRMACPAP